MRNYAKAVLVVALSVILIPAQESKKPILDQQVKPEPIVEVTKQEPTPNVPETPVKRVGCEIAYNYDWPQKIAYAVCMAESGGNQNAHNATDNHRTCMGSFSLFQVGCFWYPYYGYSENDFYNPEINTQIAYNIWKRQGGFRAWSAYNNGSYLRYL